MKFLAQDIDRRDWADLGPEGFKREYGAALRPVVVSGAIDHWGASGMWTQDFFRQNYGKRIVKIDGREWPLGAVRAPAPTTAYRRAACASRTGSLHP